MHMSTRLGIVTVVGVAVSALVGTASFAATPTYQTKTAHVHVRSAPNSSASSTVVATLGAAGSKVTLTCVAHTVSGGSTHTWYRIAQPAGYVAGHNLTVGHHKTTLPACH